LDVGSVKVQLWPLAVYFGVVILIVAFMLVSSYILGERHLDRGANQPYESGIRPTGSAWTHFDVKYYLIAMFFVIFDVEAIFVYAWVVSLRQVGWTGFVEMSVFIGLVFVALAYLWRIGALDWAGFGKRNKGAERTGAGEWK
jgi:NADH-quinone oxidoreductase subunit A